MSKPDSVERFRFCCFKWKNLNPEGDFGFGGIFTLWGLFVCESSRLQQILNY